MICQYGKSRLSTDRKSDKYLTVNNVGCYKDIDTLISVKRPKGRLDYQLIYVERGDGEFWLEDKITTVGEGNIVLFRPGERQVYSFSEKSHASFYWIHFSGFGAEEILGGLMLNYKVFKVNSFFSFKEYVEKMIFYCSADNFISEMSLVGTLISLLSEISKRIYLTDLSIDKVIEMMKNGNADECSNKKYAEICGVSEYHFIRKFKKYTGVSPHRYETRAKISKACSLIENTNMSVSEIAAMTGYADSLYFSRVFKKVTGLSPVNYKNKFTSDD